MSAAVRVARREDAPRILELVRELAEYEKAAHEVVARVEDYERDGFGERPLFSALVAEEGARIVGFALYFFAWSTWEGRGALRLEDLYVEPARRGSGVGLALMRALAAEAKRAGCTRFEWQVLDWNAPAIAFYEKLGARVLPEWRVVRITGEALDRLGDATARTAGT